MKPAKNLTVSGKTTAKNSPTRVLTAAVLMAIVATSGLANAVDSTNVKPAGFVAVPEEGERAGASYTQTPVAISPHDTESKAAPSAALGKTNDLPGYEGLSQEDALRKAWLDELEAIKKKEDLELQAVRTREETERRHAEVDQDIAKKKRKIYEYRTKQDEYASQIEAMKTELIEMDGRAKEIEKDVALAEEHAKVHQDKFSQAQNEFKETKGQLTAALDNLKKTREYTSKKINDYMIQMQRMRAEAATTEADIARADNDRSRAEAEELQVRSQWSSLTARTQALRQEKARVLAELSDMKTNLSHAQAEYKKVKAEADQAEHEKNVAVENAAKQRSLISSEMRKLETDSAYAYDQKAQHEAEKVRLAAELEKLKSDLAYVKKRNADAHADQTEAEGTVMESRLQFETAKADLTKELATGEVVALRDDSRSIQVRGLASAADQSGMYDNHRPWVATKSCHLTRSPSSDGGKGPSVTKGDRLIASPAGDGFVKVLNSSGGAAYLPMSCGHFAE